MASGTALDRFWANVEKTKDCWLWQGYIDSAGYGQFAPYNGRTILVHRFAYETFTGKIPQSFTIDHLCRHRGCVNPAHLEAVTLRENLIRGIGFPGINQRKTHCINGHQFTPENTYSRKDKKARECKICRLENVRRWLKIKREQEVRLG